MKIVRTRENLAEAKAKHAAQVEIERQPQVQEERAPASSTENLKDKPSVKTDEELRLQQAEYDQLKEAARLEALTPEQRYKADWEADSDLRKEFRGDFEVYLAFKKAEASGKVYIIRDRTITA